MDEIRARLHNHKAGQAFLVENWEEGSDSSWCAPDRSDAVAPLPARYEPLASPLPTI